MQGVSRACPFRYLCVVKETDRIPSPRPILARVEGIRSSQKPDSGEFRISDTASLLFQTLKTPEISNISHVFRIGVRSSGFEPPRYCYRQPLKLVRLPVPPRPRSTNPNRRGFPLSNQAKHRDCGDRYLFGGAWAGGCAGAGAGAGGRAGALGAGAGVVFFAGVEDCVCSRTEPVLNEPVGARFTDSVSEVIMKTMAHQVVARERNVAAPRGPKAV